MLKPTSVEKSSTYTKLVKVAHFSGPIIPETTLKYSMSFGVIYVNVYRVKSQRNRYTTSFHYSKHSANNNANMNKRRLEFVYRIKVKFKEKRS